MKTFSLRQRLYACALEDRTVPAATAIVKNGVLTIVGDTAGDNVQVTVNAANSMDVSVNGGAAQTFTVPKGIYATLGSGNDTFTLDLNGNTTNLLNVYIQGGAGDDTIMITGGTLRCR